MLDTWKILGRSLKFIQFEMKANLESQIKCPCKQCNKHLVRPPRVESDHLLKNEFVENYYECTPSLQF